ncbi:aminopeptidase P family protein [Pseudorhodobacter turbinis]|uniref:aminopeptidase P family protein n=1 Tax=Pseudorhodobacter turbinis TaxID=2500533 RepID=UPI00143CCA13|nr:aminopeptidase P family protein [Pseudorhodobacter turbinis]
MQAKTTSSADRLACLRREIAAQGLDGLILTTADAFQNEEAPAHDRTLAWLTGFSGSLAHALVLPDRAIFLVDGRYRIQAARQVEAALWDFGHLHSEPLAQWLKGQRGKIGFDPMCWTVNQIEQMQTEARGVSLHAFADPFAAIWQDRPPPPCAPLRALPILDTGRSTEDKLRHLQRETIALQVDLWVETRPDNIAWMFNVRGADIAMNPLPLSFAVFPSYGPAQWFIDPAKLTIPLPENVQTHPRDHFLSWLQTHTKGQRAAFDPTFTPEAVRLCLTKAGALVIPSRGLITVEKSRKSKAELVGFRSAHLADAVALARFGHWLSMELPAREATNQPIDEAEAANMLEQFRKACPAYQEPSFTTIAASGENAALCHYAPPAQGSAPLLSSQIFLCDSGGQYDFGTTDITRTFAFGPVPRDIRPIATAVLQGFIALCAARFPEGTMPHQLDALARAPLWALGLDYDHGTGHSVGHNLLVHEHPHRIGKAANSFGLMAGHVLTIEPGYYEEGHWGIRIENQVEVVKTGPGFLGFDPMTMAPIDLSLFDLAALSRDERDWLDAYHARVCSNVAPELSDVVKDWLITATRPVSMS